MNDSELDRRIFLTGTTEPPSERQWVRAGPVTAVIDTGALRTISYGDLELIRQIDFPVRDENWVSLPPKLVFEELEETSAGFRYTFHFEVAEGALFCRVSYEASSDGVLTATGEAEAKRDFVTNRTGFTLLHPIDGFAGNPVQLRTVSGGIERLTMPEQISPAQPMRDIAGLTFDAGGTRLDIAFTGETFEMEDQRNWSDASYKTYCRPLVEPFAYKIKAGSTLRQVITATMSGDLQSSRSDENGAFTVGACLDEVLPECLLAIDDGWFPDDDELALLVESGLKALLLRVTPTNAEALLAKASTVLEALSGELDLEVVLDDSRAAELQLKAIAALCADCGLTPRHVMALPADYLMSYQPTSVWPQGLSPEDAYAAARSAFPAARIGGGMLTNFTEFNRCRPDRVGSDYITHCNTATVHAADDASVMETLEALPHIFKSARAIGGDRAYRLGLTAIGMRTNPYGAMMSDNPDQHRLTMAAWDPRVRALFGAAFAVGILAATEGQGVEAIALAGPTGPFGLLASRAEVKRPWYDDHDDAVLHPIFHLLRALSRGTKRHAIGRLPKPFAGVVVSTGDEVMTVIANLTNAPAALTLASGGEVALLDAASFPDAAMDALWLERAMAPLSRRTMTLDAYASLFLKQQRDPSQT